MRLSWLGERVAVVYDPGLVTREETPERIGQLIKQRTRWALGFMQVLSKGEWKKLPTRSRGSRPGGPWSGSTPSPSPGSRGRW